MSIAAYRDEEATYCWQLVCPPPSMPGSTEYSKQSAIILAEISEFRGRTLHAGGRRPRFAVADGYADDDQPLAFRREDGYQSDAVIQTVESHRRPQGARPVAQPSESDPDTKVEG